MTIEIELPDGTVLEAPDGADPERVAKAYLSKQSQQPKPLSPGMVGFRPGDKPNFGIGDFFKPIAGIGENALMMGTGAAAQIPAGLHGIGASLLPGGKTGAQAVNDTLGALTYMPRTQEGQRIADTLGGAAEGLDARVKDTLSSDSPLLSTALEALLYMPPALAGARAIPKPSAKAKLAPPPTTPELFQAGSAAFKSARQHGAKISPQSGERFRSVFDSLRDEGGQPLRFNETLHPDSSAVLADIRKAAQKDLSFDDLVELRELAADAAGAQKPRDAFRGRVLRDAIDDFIDGIGADDIAGGNSATAVEQLRIARDNWSRARKAEVIDRIIEKAATSAQSYSGSGFENSLRINFKNLANNDKKIKIFNKAERDAILAVARGDSLDNLYRAIGKFNPKGVITGGLLPVALSTVSPALALSVAGAGALARRAATKRTIANANAASETVRRGSRKP